MPKLVSGVKGLRLRNVHKTRSAISSVFLEMKEFGVFSVVLVSDSAWLALLTDNLGLGISQVSRLPLAFLQGPRELGVWSWGARSGSGSAHR